MDDELIRRMTLPSQRRRTSIDGTIRRPVRNQLSRSPYAVNRQPVETKTPAATIAEPVLSSRPKQSHDAQPSKRRLIIGVGIFLVFLAGLGLYLFVLNGKSVADKTGPALLTNLNKPNFTPLVPQGEAQLANQNASTSFNKAQDSYTFKDLYLGVPISVSEQPMPSNSDTNITSKEVIGSLVKKYSATTAVNYLGGTAYIANVGVTNKQIIIFDDKGILVFIQSNMNIQADAWVSYIDNLYQP